MLNNSGIKKQTGGMTNQILANVELQCSIGCIVPQSLGVEVGGKKIAKAGTPIHVNLENVNATAEVPTAEGSAIPMNAVLLHDVDVTDGNANGTALIFGFVNLSRVDTATVSKITEASAIKGSTQMITFMKL